MSAYNSSYSVGEFGRKAFKYREIQQEYETDKKLEQKRKQQKVFKKLREKDVHYIVCNGKLWCKDGEPVPFNGKDHAKNVVNKIRKSELQKFHIIHNSLVQDGKLIRELK